MSMFEQGRSERWEPPYLQQEELSVWGGAEYTHNRVGDRYFDQMDLSGHAERPEDYERVAELGIRTLRFGLLWERHALDPSWRWFDERLEHMGRAGLRPVASLLHHGSGPRHTSLVDPGFPEKLAAYAESVAERYPSIDLYTPVNEPHTTARFSCMYGVWYPHHRTGRSYMRALLNQLKGTVLSMAAIRRVNPGAQLIQTDDVGTITGTARLASVWTRMDARRWLPYDLLCGRVDRHHAMFAYLRAEHLREDEILWFQDHPCPPDVIGINYYPTSDRFLDHRTDLYPAGHMSSEGRFVDIEAVRVDGDGLTGVGDLLLEAWRRYGIPLAITEVHLGGCVEDQIRWLADIWEGVEKARRAGASCVAMTIWALFGSYFWNQLVTCDNGHYEPGAFDLRSGLPQPTELSRVVRQIARGETPSHAALAQRGWWHEDNRVLYPFATCERDAA